MDSPPDRIHLRDHLVEVEVGAFADERGRTQRLRFDVEAELAAAVTAAGDDVDRIVSYDVLVAAVEGALAARRFDLLEALAEEVAARVLAGGGVAAVRITAEKLDRVAGRLGVSITRRGAGSARTRLAGSGASGSGASGSGAAGSGAAGSAGARVVVAPATPPDGPAVLVPAAPGLPLPEGGDPLQLALLALDQGAFALAGRLGLAVADSRTEITAALGAGRAVVWAPARMVRAAADLPDRGGADPARLADWLRGSLAGG